MAESKILVAMECIRLGSPACLGPGSLAYAALLHSVSGAAENWKLETNRMLFMLALLRVC